MDSQNHRLVVWFLNNLPIITKVSFFFFIISLFFPLRKVFFSNSAYLTGAYSDFTSFSLYLSDILILTTWGLILISRGGARDMAHHVVKNLKWFIFWLILGFLWHYKENSGLNWYFLLKYAELIVAYETTAYIFSRFQIKKLFLKLFILLGTFQSILALTQFWLQKSVGLPYLGENLLNISILGVAKIVSGGTTFIRGYGTFPHPNLLSAFLVFSIFSLLFFIYQSKTSKTRVLYSILLFINTLGLTVTFSRGAFLALGIGLIIFFIPSLIRRGGPEPVRGAGWFKLSVLIFSYILLSFVIFHPFLLTRATISDPATLERKQYNQIALKIIKDKPIFGIGAGESVLHMEQYSEKRLETWKKQPIHNYFLLSAAELGIPGALILIWIFLWHLKSLILNLKSKLSPWHLALSAILISFLILMLFDHYFYTLQQTQMLLWVVLGFITAETQTKPAV